MLIENAINDYQLHKIRKTKVEVTIILKDKESVYQRARWLLSLDGKGTGQ